MLSKFIYLSIGTAAVSVEKFKELIEDLIQNDAFIEDEGKRIVDAFLHDLSDNIEHYKSNAFLRWNDFLEKSGYGHLRNAKSEVDVFIHDVKENPFSLLTKRNG